MNGSKKLVGAMITLSALAGTNTFAKDNTQSKGNGQSSLSCSIDGKVRQQIKKGIKEHGNDDTVALEVQADCRKGQGKWNKGYMYIDMRTAKSIQRNPDANEIISKKGSRYIAEGKSYVMYDTSYSLKANFNSSNRDEIYSSVEKNLATDKKPENKVVREIKRIFKHKSTTQQASNNTVSKPKSTTTKKKVVTDTDIDNIIKKASKKYIQ